MNGLVDAHNLQVGSSAMVNCCRSSIREFSDPAVTAFSALFRDMSRASCSKVGGSSQSSLELGLAKIGQDVTVDTPHRLIPVPTARENRGPSPDRCQAVSGNRALRRSARNFAGPSSEESASWPPAPVAPDSISDIDHGVIVAAEASQSRFVVSGYPDVPAGMRQSEARHIGVDRLEASRLDQEGFVPHTHTALLANRAIEHFPRPQVGGGIAAGEFVQILERLPVGEKHRSPVSHRDKVLGGEKSRLWMSVQIANHLHHRSADGPPVQEPPEAIDAHADKEHHKLMFHAG